MARAENRHNRRKKIVEQIHIVRSLGISGEACEQLARRRARTPKSCSCSFCRKPKGYRFSELKRMLTVE
jgi:uncharacterized protein YoaH (UPF0181 family)